MQGDKTRIVVGLDIGTTKICAIVGQMNEFGKLEVLGLGKAISDGVKEGTVRNIGKTVHGILAAVKEAEETSKININVVNAGIAGKHIKSTEHHGSFTRKSNDDEITSEDVNKLTNDMYRIVTEPGSEIIHVMPQHYTVDYEENIKDPVGMSGVKLEADFHIITAQTNSIRNIKKCVERADIEIEDMILEPLSSSLSVLSEEEKEAGIALVDIGGGTTDIAVFQDGIIRHTAVIPFGGNIITSDIKQGCAVMQNQAEQLKVRFGRALAEEANENEVVSIPGLRNRPPKEISIKNLAYIIEARMEEIIDLVMLEIERSGYKNRLAGGIVITGGGSMLKNLKQLFEYKTGMDARIGYPNEHLGKCAFEEVKHPLYATAVGLVLAGFRSARELSEEGVTGGLQYRSKAKQAGGGNFINTILKKTRDLLIDDFDDKATY
ncbi:cell division protein FtsA [Flammeovirgaceae bacterium SG7u.111]|nr:cell division protein FtsA [Flammeovirgaceae bacterium SG7u.132]WPO33812.1 cell division protein FtsA [Flammeovirgaceae bacterium SG7u.111]